VYRVSCATGEGVDELVASLFRHCPPVEPEPEIAPGLPEFLDYRPAPRTRRRYRVLRTGSGFRVVGTPPDGAELEDALRAAGVKKGAEVEIGDEVLVWE
jgi:hypothetical protein